MKKRKLILLCTVTIVLLLLAGLFVPLGSYTSQGLCPTGMPPSTVRLHFIKGQTLQQYKPDMVDQGFNAECNMTTRYVQYLL